VLTLTQQLNAICSDRWGVVRETLLIAGLSATLMFAVLAFGGGEKWAVLTLEAAASTLVLIWTWSKISSEGFELVFNRLCLPIVVFALIVVAQIVFGLSAYVYVTKLELWKYIAYGCLFLLASQCSRGDAYTLMRVLAIFGFLVSLFGLVQYLTYNGRIYWFLESTSPSVFGPYVNHNHYAGLMEMLTPTALVMALRSIRNWQRVSWGLAGMLMAATIFVSISRGGMIAFVVELVCLAIYFVGVRSSRRAAFALAAICLFIVSFLVWIDDGSLAKRLYTLQDPLHNADVISRLTVAQDGLRMVPVHPFVGWGLGVFPIVYPQFRSFASGLLMNEAHNDYLQVLIETGVLGFACVIWFIVALYWTGFRNLRATSSSDVTTTLGALVGCTGILVHSFSDFNLHVPANAALFFLLCGIASRGLEHQKLRPHALRSTTAVDLNNSPQRSGRKFESPLV
jgi:O-antigen ligase